VALTGLSANTFHYEGIYMANFSIFMRFSQETATRLYDNLSDKPYCSNDFTYGLKIRPKKTAFSRYAYLQLNNHWSDTYLIFDVDRSGAALAWDDADILAPTFITINRQNGHAHLVYELITPVWKNASEKPIKWLKSIKRDLTEILGADTGFTGLISKNPNHSRWDVLDFGGRNELVELSESAEVALLRSPRPPKALHDKFTGEGESNFLFNGGRFYGYWIGRQCANWDELRDRLSTHLSNLCISRNEPIRRRRIEYMAKYIADWVWPRRDNFGRSGRHRRKTTDEELLKIRRDNASKTVEIKRAATEEKIKKAIDKFLREGRRITKAAIAREAKVNRSTVYEYSHLFEFEKVSD
jgi:hypothetical protein